MLQINALLDYDQCWLYPELLSNFLGRPIPSTTLRRVITKLRLAKGALKFALTALFSIEAH